MTFEEALPKLKHGAHITRRGWLRAYAGLREPKLVLRAPTKRSEMTQPYVYVVIDAPGPGSGHLVPWTCSQEDMMANDWSTVK